MDIKCPLTISKVTVQRHEIYSYCCVSVPTVRPAPLHAVCAVALTQPVVTTMPP